MWLKVIFLSLSQYCVQKCLVWHVPQENISLTLSLFSNIYYKKTFSHFIFFCFWQYFSFILNNHSDNSISISIQFQFSIIYYKSLSYTWYFLHWKWTYTQYDNAPNNTNSIVLIFILWYFYLISKKLKQILYTNVPPNLKFLSLINNI